MPDWLIGCMPGCLYRLTRGHPSDLIFCSQFSAVSPAVRVVKAYLPKNRSITAFTNSGISICGQWLPLRMSAKRLPAIT